MTNIHVARKISVTNEMMTGVNVFGARVVNVILDMLESGVRVGEDERGLLLRNVDRGKEIAEEKGDFGGFRQSKIFPFHA